MLPHCLAHWRESQLAGLWVDSSGEGAALEEPANPSPIVLARLTDSSGLGVSHP